MHKNEYASNEMMVMGAALAVIRYNDEYKGIRNLFELLHIPISTPLSQVLHQIAGKDYLVSGDILPAFLTKVEILFPDLFRLFGDV